MNVETASEEAVRAKPATWPIYWLSFGIVFVIVGTITFLLFLSILKMNHGTFTYTLDDPYIHLKLSDQISHGNYGINAGQHAAPSSSILFPFLLAAVAGTRLHPYLPLILNVAALFLTVEIIRRYLAHLALACDSVGVTVMAASVVLMAVCLNLIGIVFTGLEHSLHIASVAAIIYGLALFLDKRKMPAWLPFVIVVCPLLRYEGLPLSVAAIVVLAVRGERRVAAATFILTVILVAGFSGFLMMLGLGPMPGSVLVKSSVVANGVGGGHNLIVSVARNVAVMCHSREGLLLLLIGIAAGTRCFLESPAKLRDWSTQGLMSMVLFCMIAGHAVAGRFGWFYRYEIYILFATVLIGIYLTRGTIRRALEKTGDRRLVMMSATMLGFLIVTLPYILGTAQVPGAANNVFEQQYQMHRFVAEYYKAPVAVNDLGLVSYGNRYFVLDLRGLSSPQARAIWERSKPDPAAYDNLLKRNHVHLAMIYDEWFPGMIPADWQKVGTMVLSGPTISASEKDVQFYATDQGTAMEVRKELASFKKILPSHVKLTIY